MNQVERIVAILLGERVVATPAPLAPPKPGTAPARPATTPGKPRPAVRPWSPRPRPGVNPRPKARRPEDLQN